MAVAETADLRELVERAVGRPLRQAEQAIDIVGLDRALNQAKDELERAIDQEVRRAARRWQLTRVLPRLRRTPAMVAPLKRLHELGVREAALELERLGYTGVRRGSAARAYVAPDPFPGAGFESLLNTLDRGLVGLRVRVENELVAADLADASSSALARALVKIGGRDIASRVVSTALYSGMGLTFEENEDLIDGWTWTSVLDGATCGPCAAGNGTHYDSWAEAMVDLPNGGPARVCLGGGRCRCRVLPDPAGDQT